MVVIRHGDVRRRGLCGRFFRKAGRRNGSFGGFGDGRLDRRFAEGACELLERRLSRRCRRLRLGRAGGGHGDAFDQLMQPGDEIVVDAVRLALVAFERLEDFLDAVDGGENERHRLAECRQAVAEPAHKRLGGMRQRFQPRQAEEPAGSLDGVDQAKDVAEDLGVVGILLETHELDVDHVETFVGLGHELPQQVVH